MVVKKKCPGGLKPLFVLLLLFLFGTCISSSNVYASDAFNYTSGDIVNLYTIMRDNSLYYSTENDTTYHDLLVRAWNSGDTYLERLTDNDLDLLASQLNNALEFVYITSGDYFQIYGYDLMDMSDDNMFVTVAPLSRSSDTDASIIMTFYPARAIHVTGLENRATVSGDYVYSTSLTFNKWNMSGDALETSTAIPVVGLIINKDSYGIYTNKSGGAGSVPYSNYLARANGSLQYWYRRELPNPYYNNTNTVYYIGLIYTCRNNFSYPYFTYKGYTFYNYKSVRNGFTYNLDNGIASSGDGTPTPTPVPSGSPGSGSVDLTDTNNLISNVVSSLDDTIGSGDISVSSGEIISSLNLPEVDDVTDNFWYALTEGLRVALLSDDVEVYEVDALNNTFVFDSRIFHLSENVIGSLFRIAFLCGYIFVEYKFIRALQVMWTTGRFKKVIDNMARLDISQWF